MADKRAATANEYVTVKRVILFLRYRLHGSVSCQRCHGQGHCAVVCSRVGGSCGVLRGRQGEALSQLQTA